MPDLDVIRHLVALHPGVVLSVADLGQAEGGESCQVADGVQHRLDAVAGNVVREALIETQRFEAP